MSPSAADSVRPSEVTISTTSPGWAKEKNQAARSVERLMQPWGVRDRDVPLADGERHRAVLLPPGAVAEVDPVQPRVEGHLGVRRPVLGGPDVHLGVVHPAPDPVGRGGRGDRRWLSTAALWVTGSST